MSGTMEVAQISIRTIVRASVDSFSSRPAVAADQVYRKGSIGIFALASI
jgi:hypothetical protein